MAPPYRMGDQIADGRQSDPRPPVSPHAVQATPQANGPTVASAIPARISQAESQAANRPRAYSSPGQSSPIYHNWKLKRALEKVNLSHLSLCLSLYYFSFDLKIHVSHFHYRILLLRGDVVVCSVVYAVQI